jgi:hypothetical protein
MAKGQSHRLDRATAVARVDDMIELIKKDVRIAIEIEAALEGANEVVRDELRDVSYYGAHCYNSVHQSMTLLLALTLAKLFELPGPRARQTKSARYNKSDVASIPLMIRLLTQRRCQVTLSERARDWTPMLVGMEDSNAAACEQAIKDAVDAYARLRRTQAGRNAMAKLKTFRNKVLAHTLLAPALRTAPTYNELFLLMDVARDVTDHACLAITGNNLALRGLEEEFMRMSRTFWGAALPAAAKPTAPS